jgi:glutamate-ammonia-ligase adenylyltransferase
VRSTHEKLFFGPLLEALSGRPGSLSALAAEERLKAFGFLDLRATRAALVELTRGFSRTSKLMEQLLPLLLEWCSESPDPDLALLQLRRLAEGPARSANLALVFRDTPGAAQRTCQVLGSSRMLGDALRRQPEFVQTLGDDHALTHTKPRARFVDEAVGAVEWRAADSNARRSGLRRYKRRELLRIAARDLLSFANLVETGRDLSTLAEACLEASLVSLAPKVPFAVIGMGRFGGCDLSYASDLDVLFVYDGDGPADFHEAERVAEQLLVEIGERTPEGRTFAIDAALRPEGRHGSLTRSLAGFEGYWERYGLTWEFQALIKARPAAGDTDLGRRFCELAEPFVYREPYPEESVQDVRRMKVRIEQERIPPGEDPQFHLKLGRGSLSDVEFTVQLLQLMHGARHVSLRTPETMTALEVLVAVDLLDPDDADALRESFEFCSVARNARFLVTGSERESLPTDLAEAERVARLLGYAEHPQAMLRDDYRRLTRHARQVVERVFYGRE